MSLGTARVVHGNALDLPLDDNTVDLVVTSPPYFGLRSYQDGGVHYAGQIGSEATPAEFVDALIAATREMMRVLKPSGSIWVNLGDKYCADNRGSGTDVKRGDAKWAPAGKAGFPGEGIVKQKSLMGVPWRYALRCIDDLGLILRAEVIWSKPNGLPESVTDRVRRSHETWFHFTLAPRYYSAVDEIREDHAPKTLTHRGGGQAFGNDRNPDNNWGNPNGKARIVDPLGKLPGSVWTIATQPLTVPPELGVDHFAAFPMEWPRRIITGWSPREVCTACGEGRRPVGTSRITADRGGRQFNPASGNVVVLGKEREYQITGYVCGCPDTTAPSTPGRVLDPFGGTGTTALMAKALGRDGISVDLSRDYVRLAEWRTTDPGQLAAALQIDKPEPIAPDQLNLFEDTA